MFWRASSDPAVLPVEASASSRRGNDTVNLLGLPLAVTVFREGTQREHVIIADGPRRIRLDSTGDSLLGGPVRLHYDLADFRQLRARLVSLSRLEAVVRLGRVPAGLYQRDTLALRWLRALVAWELKQDGASQIEIAIALFGIAQVNGDTMDLMRKRVARLLDLARRKIDTSYPRLFGTGC